LKILPGIYKQFSEGKIQEKGSWIEIGNGLVVDSPSLEKSLIQ
jgi:hypothetical protein